MTRSTAAHEDTTFTELVEANISQIEIETPQTTITAASGNGVSFTLDSIDATIFLEHFGENFDPEDVFSTEKLEGWAADNGYTKE